MGRDITNRLESCENKPSNFLAPIALTTNTAAQVSSTDLFVTSVTFYGYSAVSKSAAPTANAADCQLGYTDYAGTLVSPAGSPVFLDVIAKGGSVTENAKIGEKYNLKDFWLLGSTNDKIIVAYAL